MICTGLNSFSQSFGGNGSCNNLIVGDGCVITNQALGDWINMSTNYNNAYIWIKADTTQVDGLFRYTHNPVNGYVLTSNAIGLATWQPVGASVDSTHQWSIYGNGNIDSASNFIGTTNAKPFIVKTNGVQRSIVTSNGQIGYGMNPFGNFTTSQDGTSIAIDTVTVTPSNFNSEYSHRILQLAVNSVSTNTVDINGLSNLIEITGGKFTKSIDGFHNDLTITSTDTVGDASHPIASFNSVTSLQGGVTTSIYGFAGISELRNGAKAENLIGNFGATNVYVGSSVTNMTGIFLPTPINNGTVTNNLGLAIQDQSGIGSTLSLNMTSLGANSINYMQGALGVGTASPTSKFHVFGNTTSSSDYSLKIDNSNSDPIIWGDNSRHVGIGAVSSANTTLFVGAVTTDTYLLECNGNAGNVAQAVFQGSKYGVYIKGNNSDGDKYGLTVVNSGSTTLFHVLNNGYVGVGTASPTATLNVIGQDATASYFAFKVDDVALQNNFYVRNDGAVSSRIGYWINSNLVVHSTGGGNSFFVGLNSGLTNGGTDNTGFGGGALSSYTASVVVGRNVAVGTGSLQLSIDGQANTCVGWNSGGSDVHGYQNTFIGSEAGFTMNGGNDNTFLGRETGYTNNGARNVFLGAYAGYYETGSNKLFIDNTVRAGESDARLKALITGVFDADVEDQIVTLNALKIMMPYIPAYPDNATAVATLGAGALYYTDVAGEYIIKLTH